MKRPYIFLLFIFALRLPCAAQLIVEDTSHNEPFFKASKFNSKCYVGAEAIVGQMQTNKVGMLLGLNLNWVVNHKYVVSAKFHTLTTPVNFAPRITGDVNDSIALTHHYAGLAFSYILFDKKKFSLQPELSAGWAVEKYQNQRKDFAMIIPSVFAIYNTTKFFRFGLGVNYRISAGAAFNGIKNGDLGGIGGLAFIRVGTF